ncbi:MAG: terminase family protein [Deinococcota bacterium]
MSTTQVSTAQTSTQPKRYFLDYQEDWLNDTSRLKIAEKSRRIGWTYVQAYEDVRDAAKSKEHGGMDVWFTSADITAAREYINYCEQWVALLQVAASAVSETVIDKDDDVKVLTIKFSSGFRVNALSSNPKGFRSKGGKVVIDEFAFHEHADALWKAAAPSILWGYPLRVFSSHNGKNTRFYRMVEEAQQVNSRWSAHRVTIFDAIEDGLVGRILGKPDDVASKEEIEEFLEETRAIAGDEDTFEQEFNCNPQDDKTAYISYGLIYSCEHPDVPDPVTVLGTEVNDIPIEDYNPDWEIEPTNNPLYLGVDIGRTKDLTVFWLLEHVGDVLWARFILELAGMKFRHQFKNLSYFLDPERDLVTRACIDDTGLGKQLAEDAQEDFGEYRVEAVTFTNPVKQDLAVRLKRSFEDRALRNPANEVVRKDINKIKKTTTSAGNVRFEGERDKDGHADRFWALALGVHAMNGVPYVPFESSSAPRRQAREVTL